MKNKSRELGNTEVKPSDKPSPNIQKMRTLTVTNEVWQKLTLIKLENDCASMNDLILKLLEKIK